MGAHRSTATNDQRVYSAGLLNGSSQEIAGCLLFRPLVTLVLFRHLMGITPFQSPYASRLSQQSNELNALRDFYVNLALPPAGGLLRSLLLCLLQSAQGIAPMGPFGS